MTYRRRWNLCLGAGVKKIARTFLHTTTRTIALEGELAALGCAFWRTRTRRMRELSARRTGKKILKVWMLGKWGEA